MIEKILMLKRNLEHPKIFSLEYWREKIYDRMWENKCCRTYDAKQRIFNFINNNGKWNFYTKRLEDIRIYMAKRSNLFPKNNFEYADNYLNCNSLSSWEDTEVNKIRIYIQYIKK